MTVITPVHAFTADGGLASERLRSWRRHGSDRAETPDEERISPRLVVPAVVAVSLLLWFSLAGLVILAFRLPLFS